MKLCPQCDFIYENDQGLCDMDGANLVYDATPFPLAKNASPNPAGISSANSQWWRFAATAVIGVVLGTLLFLIYQVSVHPTSPERSNYSPKQVTSDSAPPVADDSGAPSNLDLAQPVPLTPPIDATPVSFPTLSREASPQSQWPRPSLVLPLPQLSESTAKENGSTSAAVRPSPSTSRVPAPKLEARKRKSGPVIDKPKAAHPKKDSSIASFLKKTGRILKKPFKF